MASVSASSRPRREVKCAKSSPTDSVAEVNTQAARVPPAIAAKRAAMSNGSRLSVKPRCVSSTLRAPSLSSACTTASSRAASSVARAAHCAMPGSRLCSLSAAASVAQRARQILRGIGERRVRRQPVGPRRGAQDFRERRQRFLDGAEFRRQRACAGARACASSCARVAHQQLHLAAAEARAEELRGEIGDLVRLVEDHRVRRAEQVAEAVFLEREVGEQQVVIDDDDVGLDGLAARLDHVAAADVGAARAEAVVARRGDLRPQRMRVAEVRHFGEVAGLA